MKNGFENKNLDIIKTISRAQERSGAPFRQFHFYRSQSIRSGKAVSEDFTARAFYGCNEIYLLVT